MDWLEAHKSETAPPGSWADWYKKSVVRYKEDKSERKRRFDAIYRPPPPPTDHVDCSTPASWVAECVVRRREYKRKKEQEVEARKSAVREAVQTRRQWLAQQREEEARFEEIRQKGMAIHTELAAAATNTRTPVKDRLALASELAEYIEQTQILDSNRPRIDPGTAVIIRGIQALKRVRRPQKFKEFLMIRDLPKPAASMGRPATPIPPRPSTAPPHRYTADGKRLYEVEENEISFSGITRGSVPQRLRKADGPEAPHEWERPRGEHSPTTRRRRLARPKGADNTVTSVDESSVSLPPAPVATTVGTAEKSRVAATPKFDAKNSLEINYHPSHIDIMDITHDSAVVSWLARPLPPGEAAVYRLSVSCLSSPIHITKYVAKAKCKVTGLSPGVQYGLIVSTVLRQAHADGCGAVTWVGRGMLKQRIKFWTQMHTATLNSISRYTDVVKPFSMNNQEMNIVGDIVEEDLDDLVSRFEPRTSYPRQKKVEGTRKLHRKRRRDPRLDINMDEEREKSFRDCKASMTHAWEMDPAEQPSKAWALFSTTFHQTILSKVSPGKYELAYSDEGRATTQCVKELLSDTSALCRVLDQAWGDTGIVNFGYADEVEFISIVASFRKLLGFDDASPAELKAQYNALELRHPKHLPLHTVLEYCVNTLRSEVSQSQSYHPRRASTLEHSVEPEDPDMFSSCLGSTDAFPSEDEEFEDAIAPPPFGSERQLGCDALEPPAAVPPEVVPPSPDTPLTLDGPAEEIQELPNAFEQPTHEREVPERTPDPSPRTDIGGLSPEGTALDAPSVRPRRRSSTNRPWYKRQLDDSGKPIAGHGISDSHVWTGYTPSADFDEAPSAPQPGQRGD